MSEKIIKSRIIHKHGLEAHWLLATNFIPKQGEIIVYDIEVDADGNMLTLPDGRTTPYTHQRLKIGDGITTVSELPFVVSEDEGDSKVSTQSDNAISLTKTVPTNTAKYAEINELGGITHKEEITTEGDPISGPHTFSNLSVSIPAAQAPTGEFEYVVYLKNTGTTTITVQLNANASMWSVQGISLPADGEFHLYTGSSSFNYGQYDWTLEVLNDSYNKPENVEASTIAFYEVGGSTKVTEVLRPTVVTAIESASYNILDLTPALNECLRDNGDGTYTLTKTANSRFSGFIPLYIPKGQEVFSYIEIVNTSIDGLTRISLQLFGADKIDNRSSIGLSNGGQAFAPQAETFFAKAYLQHSYAEGAYVTFRSPMIKYGKSAEFSPYAKHTLPIPAEVQALEGWGMGVNETYHNRLLWAEKKYRQEVARYVFTGDNLTNWEDSNRNFVGLYLDNVIPYLNVQGNDIRAVCNDFTVYARVPLEGERGIGLRQTGAMNRLYIRDDSFSSAADFKAYFAEKYASGNPVTIDYVLATPIVTDISDIIGNNVIEVEAGGTLTFISEHGYDVPSTINYYISDNTDTVYTGRFVGDVTGTATSAVYDGEGNNIVSTYTTRNDVADYTNTAKQEAISAANKYTNDIVSGSPITFYDAETIKNNIQISESNSSTYVENGYAYAHATSWFDIRAGIKVADGVVKLDYDVLTGGLNAGFSASFLIGEFKAEEGKEYSIPKTQIDSSDYENIYIYVTSSTSNRTIKGEFIETSSITNPESGEVYSIGYYDAFTFTATETEVYRVWVGLSTNNYYWSTVQSGIVATFSYPMDKYATKEYVDSKLTESSKTILDFLVSKIGTPNVVFGTDTNGQLTAMSINDLAAAIMRALPAAEEGEF